MLQINFDKSTVISSNSKIGHAAEKTFKNGKAT
jgi:hypothetical protein